MVPPIKTVIALDPFVVRVVFADGAIRDVDIEPLLDGPVFRGLRDLRVFQAVKVDGHGDTIVWPNGADLDPDVLYGSKVPSEPPFPVVRSVTERSPAR